MYRTDILLSLLTILVVNHSISIKGILMSNEVKLDNNKPVETSTLTITETRETSKITMKDDQTSESYTETTIITETEPKTTIKSLILPTSTTNTANNATAKPKETLSTEAIIGIAIGAFFLGVIITALGAFIIVQIRSKKGLNFQEYNIKTFNDFFFKDSTYDLKNEDFNEYF